VNKDYPISDYRIIKEDLNIHYVPLLDVAIGVKFGKNDPAFAEGVKKDIFIRSPETGKRFRGHVWPGDAYFPDFFHPNITQYWADMMKNL
jgi:alpha-glucosidase (family GH31 glycosyl hydrolase)